MGCRRLALTLALPTSLVLGWLAPPAAAQRQEQQAPSKGRKVVKTEAEWRKLLTPQQFMVTRLKETEPAFSNRYWSNHAKGTYRCVCCGAGLFSSQTKFDSGTGWPSFWRPIDPRSIETAPDNHLAEPRVEVMCNDCGAHLGHVFDDGPPPTNLRFCINSAALKFVPLSAATPKMARPSAKAKSKGKASPKGARDSAPDPTDPPPADPKPARDKDSSGG